MRPRVWGTAHVGLREATLDTDTTVQAVYGRQMGARQGYSPQPRGKKSDQPILTFLTETREYLGGGLRQGERPHGKQTAAHLDNLCAALPGNRGELLCAGGFRILLLGGCRDGFPARVPVGAAGREDVGGW
jgi:hypothetical protein